MRLILLFALLTAIFSFPDPNRELETAKSSAGTEIATATKNDVTVEISQLQFQRIGSTPELFESAKKFGLNMQDKFKRTIALSLRQKGNGNSSGPIYIKLRNGKTLTPFLNGNQKLMSAIANARYKQQFDFSEYWFSIPSEIQFADVFPIKVYYTTSNRNGDSIDFNFAEITP